MTDFIQNLEAIQDVRMVNLRAFGDERGRFMEVFRSAWFPEADWSRVQSNHSTSQAGVLRGLHYHFNQVDYWHVPVGRIRVGLADMRPGSPTQGQSHTMEIGGEDALGVFIPVGVAHGFYALTDCILIYYVNNYYDGGDEFGVAWNDPDLKLNWGTSNPVLSGRDQSNPFLRDILADNLPQPLR